MKKIRVLFVIVFFLALVTFFKNDYIFAEDINSIEENNKVADKEEIDKDKKESEVKENQRKEIINMINECLKDIKTRLIAIESKEEKVKKQKEFENYPAIRLNVDTPFFGFISMVDNKLKIRKDVSTVDVANGYSIKDIVNKNKIKLPDFSVGSIVVTTRDVDINDKMSYEDSSYALFKIMQYISQLESADEFLDFQINRTFRGYIDKEKSDKINDIKYRNNKVISSLIDLDKKITYLHIIKNDDVKLIEIEKEYDSISMKSKNINLSVKDMLISSESLIKIQKDVIDMEGNLLELTTTIDKEYEEAINSIDEEKILLDIKEELVTRKNNVKKYVDSSTYTKKIESDSEDKNIDEEKKDESKEIITKYEVTSKNTLEYLNSAISIIDERIAKYVKVEDEEKKEEQEEKKDPISQEVANKEDVTKVEVKSITKEEKRALVDELYKIYSDFLIRENKFYLDNTNFLINDTTKKTSDLIGKTEANVLSYMKYMYIELPGKLKGYINNNNMNSKYELKRLTENLKEELKTIVNSNVKVTELYDKMIQEELNS